jgi:putative transcriptional regulator
MKNYRPDTRAVRRFCVLNILTYCLLSAFSGRDFIGAAEHPQYLTGQLLVATPEMADPRFAETVIYMVKHDADGAMGLVINKPMAKGPLDDLLESSGKEATGSNKDIVVHYGGPVGQRQGFLLHTDEVVIEGTTKIAGGIAMTTDSKILEEIAAGRGPRQGLFILGYAGWAPGQLEMELQTKSWFTIPADKALIFGDDADKKWRQAVDKRQIPL